MAVVQKQQAIAETTVKIEQAKSQFDINEMNQKAQLDKELLQLRYQYDMQLKQMEVSAMGQKEAMIEDRKDQRTKLEGTQQSQMIAQRQNRSLPTDFEMQGAVSDVGPLI